MIACKAGAAQESLDAAMLAAIAGRAQTFVIAGPRQWIVTPFAGNRLVADQDAATHDNAAASTLRLAGPGDQHRDDRRRGDVVDHSERRDAVLLVRDLVRELREPLGSGGW